MTDKILAERVVLISKIQSRLHAATLTSKEMLQMIAEHDLDNSTEDYSLLLDGLVFVWDDHLGSLLIDTLALLNRDEGEMTRAQIIEHFNRGSENLMFDCWAVGDIAGTKITEGHGGDRLWELLKLLIGDREYSFAWGCTRILLVEHDGQFPDNLLELAGKANYRTLNTKLI